VKIPEFQRHDGGGSQDDAAIDAAPLPMGVSATATPGGIVLANEPLIRMTFSPDGFHFPSSLQIANNELIVTPAVGCAEERAAGVALYPAIRIDSATAASVGLGEVHIDLAGPGVAKVALDWTAMFPCGGSTGLANGRTTFTMFGDGRVNRSDYLAIPGQPLSTDCDCAGDDAWYLSSYFTFARDQITNVIGATPTADTGTQVPSTACATGNGFQLGMGWRTGHSTRARLPQGAVAGGTIAFIENLTNPGATNTLTNNFSAASQTTWFAAATSTCTDVRAQVAPYQDNSAQPLPTLAIQAGSNAPNNYGVALDGIFGGETAQAIAGGIGFPDDTLTLTTATPLAGFAFWVDVGAGYEIASVHKSPSEPATTWYSVQTPTSSPTQRVLWFPDGLTTSDSITITVQQ
jgi:hypothetical protein